MRAIHWNKCKAVWKMKWRTLFSKNFIVMPLFAIGITIVLKIVYASMGENGDNSLPDFLRALVLGLGATMNVAMTGILCTAMSLAEEKEKHTLRVLMTSSVNGLEFFLGSILPVMILTVAVNALLVVAAGVRLGTAGWAGWIFISVLCTLASAVLGMIFGMCAKNQVSASTITTVPLLILALIPGLASFHPLMGKISSCLFTGVLMNTAGALVEGRAALEPLGLAVVALQIVLAAAAFLLLYRRNGYDAD